MSVCIQWHRALIETSASLVILCFDRNNLRGELTSLADSKINEYANADLYEIVLGERPHRWETTEVITRVTSPFTFLPIHTFHTHLCWTSGCCSATPLFFVLFTSLSFFAQDRTNRTKDYAKLTSAVDFKANIHPPRDAHNTTYNPTRILQLFNNNAWQRYSKPRSPRHKQTQILQRDQSIMPPWEECQVFPFLSRMQHAPAISHNINAHVTLSEPGALIVYPIFH